MIKELPLALPIEHDKRTTVARYMAHTIKEHKIGLITNCIRALTSQPANIHIHSNSKMSLVDDTETEGFSFIWTIQNFSFCSHKVGEQLYSPGFMLGTEWEDEWCLRLLPIGPQDAIGLFLKRNIIRNSGLPSPKNVHFALSIRTFGGQFKKLGDSEFNFAPADISGWHCFLKLHELYKKGAFLDKDSLTLRCRIWKVNDLRFESARCNARTIIGVRRFNYVCPYAMLLQNKGTNADDPEIPASPEMPFLRKYIISSREEHHSANITVDIEINQTDESRPCFATCEVSVVDGWKMIYSGRHEHWFKKDSDSRVWRPSFNTGSITIDDAKLLFKCELAASADVAYSMIESMEHGELNPPRSSDQAQKSDLTDSLKDDLRRFHSNGRLCDMTIRTSSKDFPVHKSILCARSPVFCAMFERDMSENRTGVVEIEDVDAGTIAKLLLFVYTDVVEDLEWGSASQLYFAADKYGIAGLRRACSDFLKENLDSSKVCDVLVLAERHQDFDLKSVVQDFILKHAPEVMASDEWMKLMKEQLQLASEIMHIICVRNLKI